MNSSLVLANLRKVNYARLKWVNGKGSERDHKPEMPTVNGEPLVPHEMAAGGSETMLELASRRRLLDTWSPVLVIQFGNSHALEFTNPKTVNKIWRAFNGIVYRKDKS